MRFAEVSVKDAVDETLDGRFQLLGDVALLNLAHHKRYRREDADASGGRGELICKCFLQLVGDLRRKQ